AVTGLMPGQVARIWLPVPSSNEDQVVAIIRKELPAEGKMGKEAEYGNQVLYVEAKANAEGKVPVAVTYRVQRKEVRADLKNAARDTEDVKRFLQPDVFVPIDGKPLTLLASRDLPRDQLELGRVLYDVVNDHMRYSKEGTGWGRGDAVWACDSRFGNCSDF